MCLFFCQSAANPLHHLIKCLEPDITDNEAILAESNLIGFFKKLEDIEQRLAKEKSAPDLNQRRNEDQHENYGS